jgi:hypothetical protein
MVVVQSYNRQGNCPEFSRDCFFSNDTTQIESKMSTPSKLPSTLANAEFNAFAEAISPEPLGDRKPEVGELLYCPASNIIFCYKAQSGGVKTGTVIFNMDKDLGRAEVESAYRLKSVSQRDYHPVSRAVFDEMMWPKSLQEAAPNLFGAIVASDITVEQLKRKVSNEIRRSPSTRSSLIEDLLVMCAKRHIGNEGRMGLDAVMCEVPADAKARISEVEQAAQKEWQSLVAAVEIKLSSPKTQKPQNLLEGVSDESNSSNLKNAATGEPDQVRPPYKNSDTVELSPSACTVVTRAGAK